MSEVQFTEVTGEDDMPFFLMFLFVSLVTALASFRAGRGERREAGECLFPLHEVDSQIFMSYFSDVSVIFLLFTYL